MKIAVIPNQSGPVWINKSLRRLKTIDYKRPDQNWTKIDQTVNIIVSVEMDKLLMLLKEIIRDT